MRRIAAFGLLLLLLGVTTSLVLVGVAIALGMEPLAARVLWLAILGVLALVAGASAASVARRLLS